MEFYERVCGARFHANYIRPVEWLKTCQLVYVKIFIYL